MCVLFFFSLSLATFERINHQRCSLKKVFLIFLQNWQDNTCVGAGLKETPAQVFSHIFYKILIEHHFSRFLGAFAVSLWLESPIFLVFLSSNLTSVYWSFASLCMFLFYSSSDNNHKISFDSYKVYTLFVYWISCHLVFFFELMSWCNKEKKMWKLQWMF